MRMPPGRSDPDRARCGTGNAAKPGSLRAPPACPARTCRRCCCAMCDEPHQAVRLRRLSPDAGTRGAQARPRSSRAHSGRCWPFCVAANEDPLVALGERPTRAGRKARQFRCDPTYGSRSRLLSSCPSALPRPGRAAHPARVVMRDRGLAALVSPAVRAKRIFADRGASSSWLSDQFESAARPAKA